MYKVIILNGKGASGKDTLVDFVRKYDRALFDKERIAHTSMVNRVKDIAMRCGWNGGKDVADRKFLYELKKLLGEYNDLPYQSVVSFINCFNGFPNVKYIFVDAREAKDIDRLKENYNCITVLVIRGDSIEMLGNPADDSVYDYTYDYVIENSGTLEDYEETCKTFWNEIINRESEDA